MNTQCLASHAKISAWKKRNGPKCNIVPRENHLPLAGSQSSQREPPSFCRKSELPERTTFLLQEARVPRGNHHPLAGSQSSQREPPTFDRKPEFPERTTFLLQEARENHLPLTGSQSSQREPPSFAGTRVPREPFLCRKVRVPERTPSFGSEVEFPEKNTFFARSRVPRENHHPLAGSQSSQKNHPFAEQSSEEHLPLAGGQSSRENHLPFAEAAESRFPRGNHLPLAGGQSSQREPPSFCRKPEFAENHLPLEGSQSFQREPPSFCRKPEFPEGTTFLWQEARVPRENHLPFAGS
ncbi:Hypothetical predicted protein [Mytilus galloprovincialis]|uniref:Uncharacterized protein n=1 Tax=Mytilus galloprovincialis TaxID=29158 RepID=A0A8B6D749_MYTGA|nr:Hypothetical predicted protein [Mytilus galloprovincialis]